MRHVVYQWAGIGILSLIGWGISSMPAVTSWIPSYIIWGLALIWLVIATFYWIKRRRHLNIDSKKENASDSLIDTLINLHKQMMHFKDVRLKQNIDKQAFDDAVPLLFHKWGLVDIGKWDEFEKKTRKSLRKHISKSPKKSGKRYFEVISAAEQLKKELCESKEWSTEDGMVIGEWLDGLDIGISELRDKDKNWQDMYRNAEPYMRDEKLRELIDRHISSSYMLSSGSLCIGYSNKIHNKTKTRLLYIALVGSPIRPEQIDLALSEILSDIEKRQQMMKKKEEQKLLESEKEKGSIINDVRVELDTRNVDKATGMEVNGPAELKNISVNVNAENVREAVGFKSVQTNKEVGLFSATTLCSCGKRFTYTSTGYRPQKVTCPHCGKETKLNN
ncbi:MAG: hypothetical protein JXA51_01560 [Dehalococcoidales bacterium]|nr:hypothetical protein [Dehalococcoidales bacterium]